MGKRPINVYIADDSKVSRDLLSHILTKDPEIQVIGFGKSGEETLGWLSNHSADVITMDLIMPGMDGFEVTRRIMQTKPTPIVIISGGYSSENSKQAFQAVEAGALAILEKPVGYTDPAYDLKVKEIIRTIKMVSEVKLVKRRMRSKPSAEFSGLEGGCADVVESVEGIAIGASLGGPMALSLILSSFPQVFPVPLFIVQHIAEGFTAGLANWLQKHTRLTVCLAKEGDRAKPGYCYIAPSGAHMEVKRGGVISLDYGSKDFLKPSISRLFKSMADAYGSRAIGVILTGMGKDGAEELALMKKKGAYTIAQDEESCVMFGMPKEAIMREAACQVLPLDRIGKTLTYLVIHSRLIEGGIS